MFSATSHPCERSCQRCSQCVAIGASADPLPTISAGRGLESGRQRAERSSIASSDQMIALAQSHGGWGTGCTTFQIDFSMAVLHADASTPTVANIGYPYDDYYSPDCDDPGTVPFPLPPGGTIEGSGGYSCDERQRRLPSARRRWLDELYESYHSNVDGRRPGIAMRAALGPDARLSAGRPRRAMHERRRGRLSVSRRSCSTPTKSTRRSRPAATSATRSASSCPMGA